MRLTRPLALLALVCLPGPLLAEAELEARFWQQEMDGKIRISEGGRGTEIQLPETLGIEEDDAFEVRLTWSLPGPLIIRFGYVPLSYAGEARIEEEIDFGGSTFPIAFDVATALDLDYYRAGVGWMFSASENFKIGPILEVKGLQAEAELRGSLLSIPLISERESEEGAFAAIGIAFEGKQIPTLRIVGEVGYSPGLDYGELLDAELGVRFSPVKVLNIFAGYRLLDFDLEFDDDLLDLEISGPYAGLSLSF